MMPKNGAAPGKPSPSKEPPKPGRKPFFSKFRKTSKEPPKVGAPSKEASPSPNPKPKSKITPTIIISIVLGMILLMMIIAFSLFLVLEPTGATSSINVCKTPQCVGLAHHLLNWGDNTTDPCDNFYQYTCGKYVEHVNLDNPAMVRSSALLENVLKEHIAKIKKPRKKAEIVMKKLWDRCENLTRKTIQNGLDDASLKDLYNDITEVGNWPMVNDNFHEKDFVLNFHLEKMATTLKFPLYGIFSISVDSGILITPDPTNFLEEFKNVEVNILQRMFQQNNVVAASTFSAQMSEVIDFVGKLPDPATATMEIQQRIPIKVDDLKRRFQKVDFERLLRESMSAEQWEIKKKMIEVSPALYARLDNLISNTSPTVLANYLMVHAILVANRGLSNKVDQGCKQYLAEQAPSLVLSTIVRHYFNKKNLEKASEMVDGLQAAFRKMLESSTWLQESTKKNAVKKLDKMRKVIGYTEEFMDMKAADERFEKKVSIKLDDSQYRLSNQLLVYYLDLRLDAVDQPFQIDKNWLETNAFYMADQNALMLCVPIMDDPMFDASFPKYAQIASIGFISGHEIGHGFDPSGSMYDENGKQRNWWTAKDRREFKKRSRCVINKYNNYDDPAYGKKLNGTATVDENVADLLGAQTIWNAYKSMDVSGEQKIAGFEDYSIDKLFFRIAALSWCSPHSTRPLDTQLIDDHGVYNYRVNGVFSNMKEFSETFNCPVGSKMNPKKKCPIF